MTGYKDKLREYFDEEGKDFSLVGCYTSGGQSDFITNNITVASCLSDETFDILYDINEHKVRNDDDWLDYLILENRRTVTIIKKTAKTASGAKKLAFLVLTASAGTTHGIMHIKMKKLEKALTE